MNVPRIENISFSPFSVFRPCTDTFKHFDHKFVCDLCENESYTARKIEYFLHCQRIVYPLSFLFVSGNIYTSEIISFCHSFSKQISRLLPWIENEEIELNTFVAKRSYDRKCMRFRSFLHYSIPDQRKLVLKLHFARMVCILT